jgi:membrane fusion protein, adhesin transport system
LTVGGGDTPTNNSFEDSFNGAVVIEQVSHSQLATVEGNIIVERDKRSGWFWDTIRESASTYQNMFLVSVFINLLALGLPIFAMIALDEMRLGTTYLLWPLAVGAALCYLYIVALWLIRSHFLSVVRTKADPEASQFFSYEVMSALFDMPFVLFVLALVGYIGGILVVFPLVSFALVACCIFVFGDARPGKQTLALLQLIYGLGMIALLASGIAMVHSNTLTIGALAAVLALAWHGFSIISKILLVKRSYQLVKTAYENSDRTLRLSIEYDGVSKQGEPSTKIIAWTLLSMLSVFVAWTGFVQIDEKVCARGAIMPSEQIYKIQTIDGGTIEKLLVKEGDKVDVNQTVMKLNASLLEAKATENRIRLFVLMAKAERLTAENENKAFVPSPKLVKGVPFNVKREQAQYLKDVQLYLVSLETAKAQLKLAGSDEVKMKEANARLAQIRATFKANLAKELGALNVEIEKLKFQQKSLDDKVAHCAIISPIKGVVKKTYQEAAGDAVLPNAGVVDLEPIYDSIFVEAKIKASDMSFVKLRQEANIKAGARLLKGKVDFISPNAVKDAKSEKFYTVKIKADKPDEKNKLSGEVKIEIATGKQSILGHLIRPVFGK